MGEKNDKELGGKTLVCLKDKIVLPILLLHKLISQCFYRGFRGAGELENGDSWAGISRDCEEASTLSAALLPTPRSSFPPII